MSSLRNLIRRRIHKERAQPKHRERMGLLEKKKDYKLRAIDFHRKQDTLHKLRQKAAFRNPDEFYFNMHNSHTKDGVHLKKRGKQRFKKEIMDANTQDLNYLTMKRQQEQKRIENLQSSLHMIGDEADILQQPLNGENGQPSHTIFVDRKEDLETFDASTHFDTDKDHLKSRHNRVRRKKAKRKKEATHHTSHGLENGTSSTANGVDGHNHAHQNGHQNGDAGSEASEPKTEKEKLQKIKAERVKRKQSRKRARMYKELSDRMERKQKLDDMVQDAQTQRHLMGKGKVRKIVKTDEWGEVTKTQFKWSQKRKK